MGAAFVPGAAEMALPGERISMLPSPLQLQAEYRVLFLQIPLRSGFLTSSKCKETEAEFII